MNPLPPPPPAPVTRPDETTVVAAQPAMNAERAALVATRLAATANAVVAGKRDIVDVAVTTLLAGGHLLIEDIPGVGKTLLAQVIAGAVGGSFQRIQGTSDLLPSDVTGSLMPGADGATLAFRPGPIFANVVVFDELNRTTPRTQSALLELAEEGTVTVDGTSHPLPQPFMLVATQNPIDIAGTYRLGEGSLDRFAAVVSPGRASAESELEVLTGRQGRSMLDAVRPVVTLAEISAVRHFVTSIHVADPIAEYVVRLLEATRTHPSIRLGASTRGGVSLIALARARAMMHGRSYVVPDDVSSLAVTALAHRISPVEHNGSTTAGRALVSECIARVAPPTA